MKVCQDAKDALFVCEYFWPIFTSDAHYPRKDTDLFKYDFVKVYSFLREILCLKN